MVRLIIATFAVLAWAFYEMSGGAEFEPRSAQAASVTTENLQTAAVVEPAPEVTRVALNLTSVSDVEVPEPRPAVAAAPEPKPTTNDGTWQSVTLPSLIRNAEPEADVESSIEIASLVDTPVPALSDVRTVSGNRVNVRGGPGTSFGIVGKLVRGDAVEILEDTGAGWVRFRAVDSDTSGWLADFLLTDS